MSTTAAPRTTASSTIPRAAGLVTGVAAFMPTVSALTAEWRGYERDPLAVSILVPLTIAALALVTMLALVPWALKGSDRRAKAVAWVAIAVGVAAAPTSFWTMVPFIAGGAAATIAWVRRDHGGSYAALQWFGAVLMVVTVAAYIATM